MDYPELIEALGFDKSAVFQPNDVLFFTGAGISAADPTDFFLGNELHSSLLSSYSSLCKFEREAALSSRRGLAMEETISIIVKVLDEVMGSNTTMNQAVNILTEIFIYRPCTYRQPNEYHKYFNWHLSQGGNHITVNIDQFIEQGQSNFLIQEPNSITNVCSQITPATRSVLFKIHGDPNKTPIGQQGFLSEQLAMGFSAKVTKWLDALLKNSKLVVFVGYGGLDRFDVIPYFRNMTVQIDGTALWIEYSTSTNIEFLSSVAAEKRQIVSKFKKAAFVKCDPKVILNKLFPASPHISNTARNSGVLPEYVNLIQANVKYLANWNFSVSRIRRKIAWEIRRKLLGRLLK